MAAALALVEGIAAGAAATVGAVAVAATGAPTDAGDVPPLPPAGEGCVLVDFELTLPGVVAEDPEAAVLDPATGTAPPTFGAVFVAFVTTLPVGCCEVTPAGAVPLGATLEGVLVAWFSIALAGLAVTTDLLGADLTTAAAGILPLLEEAVLLEAVLFPLSV